MVPREAAPQSNKGACSTMDSSQRWEPGSLSDLGLCLKDPVLGFLLGKWKPIVPSALVAPAVKADNLNRRFELTSINALI